MNEDALLEEILALADAEGYAAAYEKLKESLTDLNQPSPQAMYFLCCLAGGSGKPDAALSHLEEAVEARAYWYRPEILDDGDLKDLFAEPEFIRLKALSDARFAAASKAAKPLFTWKEKTAPHLLIAVHGNSQNAETALKDWSPLASKELQIEAVQSGTVDSYGSFRWNYDMEDYKTVASAVRQANEAGYESITLAGFSAGCDMILRSVLFENAPCSRILLQSPWIPLTDEKLSDAASAVEKGKIEMRIYCGELDEDCCPMAERLFYALADVYANACFHRQRGLRHQFPNVLGQEYRL